MSDMSEGIDTLKKLAQGYGPEVAEDLARARHEILKVMDRHPTGITAVCMITMELIREHRGAA